MPFGTAYGRLKKQLMFSIIVKSGDDVCFRCGGKIESSDDMTIEHKSPWMDSDDPRTLFFDLGNVAFSHFSCNVGHARRPNKKYFTPEQKREAKTRLDTELKRRNYTTEKRYARYLRSMANKAEF